MMRITQVYDCLKFVFTVHRVSASCFKTIIPVAEGISAYVKGNSLAALVDELNVDHECMKTRCRSLKDRLTSSYPTL
jgi:hypothetical protein